MKKIRKIAGILIIPAVMFISAGACMAGYEFDDLKGNAFTAQWMAINQNGATLGGSYSEAIKISTDIITDYDDFSTVNVLNGHSDEEIDDRELHVLYLLVAEGQGQFYIDMKAEEKSFDIATPVPYLSTRGSTTYRNAFLPLGQPDGMDSTWRRFQFTLDRANEDRYNYDTTVQEILFMQNPNSPSQSVPRTLIISNVSNNERTAEAEPLTVRMTLRDGSAKNSNILASDTVKWDMTDDKEVGGSEAVFVPIDDDSLLIDNKKINLYLTTEVINHTSVRYAATTYDGYGDFEYPSSWKFDLARSQGTTYVDREFQLGRKAHIVPGLVTVFKRQYDVNEENKRPLMLYPIDDTSIGTRSLRLNHKIIFGKILGDVVSDTSSSKLYSVTAFQLRSAGDDFYDNVKKVTKANGSVSIPTSLAFRSGSVTRSETMPDTVLQHFTINQAIPANLKANNGEGMLPVHIRFNIPVTKISDRTWLNNLIDAQNEGKRLEDIFFDKYQISLLTETNSKNNPWNLSQELLAKNQYNKQIHVYYDPDNGTSSRDNDKGVITVSFIAMLMDGTRDGVRPELSVIEDHTVESDNDYIVIRDGNKDDRWKMTFLIAPAGYYDNPGTASASSSNSSGSKSSGGGCETLSASFALIGAALFVFLRRGRS